MSSLNMNDVKVVRIPGPVVNYSDDCDPWNSDTQDWGHDSGSWWNC